MKLWKLASMVLVMALFAVFTINAEGEKEGELIHLWGKQTAGWGGKNATTDGNRVTLAKKATIEKVDGDAKSYCIWSQGRSVLCGGEKKPIIGQTLEPGVYTVMAGLSDGQSSATVNIYLKYVD